ncbi:MAG TPA: VOC family protein [Polyangia bacterium]|nr:VOC family protein [Polyangia bacterium]
MPVTQINPYLNFGGTATKAIALYEKALGAKVENLQRFGDVPGMEVPPEAKDRVMHASLRIGGSVVMLSDGPPGKSVPSESNIWISLNYDEPQQMAAQFDALAAGGQVVMALQDTFWGAKFGMLTDAFHINWMFNCHNKGS